MRSMEINHVRWNDGFWEDYWNAPERVKKNVDKFKNMIEQLRGFPKSMHVHTDAFSEYWIGWITPDHNAWRVIMELAPEDKYVVFVRLMRHKDMDRWLSS